MKKREEEAEEAYRQRQRDRAPFQSKSLIIFDG